MTTEQPITEKPKYSASDFTDPKEVKKGADKRGRENRFLLLSTGEVVEVRTGTGRDVQSALLEIGDNREQYVSALMSRVTLFDGERKIKDDIADLDMKDYNRVQAEFLELNF